MLARLMEQYMAVAELDVSTLESYEGYIRRTILPALGAQPLRKIRGPMLDTLYARLRRCGDVACTGRPFTEHSSFPVLPWMRTTGAQRGSRSSTPSGRQSAGAVRVFTVHRRASLPAGPHL